MTAELLHGEPVAAEIREEVTHRVRELAERGVVPTLGTVLMSDDPADERFMDLKHSACDDAGVATRDVRLEPSAPVERLHGALEDLCTNPEVHAVFVQVPLPEHVSMAAVRRRIGPEKDVDCFHPENLGRLVAGNPRFIPATPAAVRRLLAAYDVPVEGEDVTIVGRSDVIGKSLANLLLQDAPCGNATVTVCHSRTSDLGEKTRRADIVVTTCGVPELVDGSMLSSGVVVVDVSANRRPADADERDTSSARSSTRSDDDGTEVVGDVEYESARNVAGAITPVPGGVGPVTLSILLRNVVLAAERQVSDRIRR
ncbi:bifunctional 5,10-methylenetetrahydrofolate dehydrogenase/5,10-methenyltetrahydrofolate cyclohydrolase [Halalkalicoccus sp. GCM10025322]|uniref:bifunctional 5,10-methylenetetrahydrofolate dehydrogenase/5,10-methenyltetrahydrofolate cyclohydrolase n=1 Tax=Halalkalicoccus TaxID=332246 RepID=UPI002F9679B1